MNPIQNTDGDNSYTVAWAVVADATHYTLEVSSTAEFTNPGVAYEGPNTNLSYSLGQPPAVYFYRVKAGNAGGSSPWSEVQSITIYPLHVGLALQWDGTGKLSFDELETVGTHDSLRFDKMTDADTIQLSGRFWYDPNPEGWLEETYTSSYSVSTGDYKPADEEGDSAWKWGYDWKLPYWSGFTEGQTIQIGDKPFTVHGPISGQTPLGNISYWELKNQGDILYYDDGEGVAQVVHAGNVTLRYETGPYGLLVFDDILRSIYFEGENTGWWVQYTSQLTTRTSNPVSTPITQTAPRHDRKSIGNQLLRPPLLQR